MTTIASRIERIVQQAMELRSDLTASALSIHPNNLAADGKTSVAAALIDLRTTIDAFLALDDPDNEITGAQSTE
jgi:hypothetical protein